MKKTITPKMRRNFIIKHEAGHALFFWLGGFVLSKVSVQNDFAYPKADGFVQAAHADSGGVDIVSPPASLTAARAFADLAGRNATETFFPDMPAGTGHKADFKNLEKLLKPDAATWAMIQWRQDHPDATVEEFYQAHKHSVAKVLKSKQGKRAISAISKALEKFGTLSGQEAASILFKAWGDPLPPLALPVERHIALNDKGPRCFNDAIRAADTYLEVIQKDLKNVLADCEDEEEIAHLERIASQVSFLKNIVLSPPPPRQK